MKGIFISVHRQDHDPLRAAQGGQPLPGAPAEPAHPGAGGPALCGSGLQQGRGELRAQQATGPMVAKRQKWPLRERDDVQPRCGWSRSSPRA